MVRKILITLFLVVTLQQHSYSENKLASDTAPDMKLPQHYHCPHGLDISADWGVAYAIGNDLYDSSIYLSETDLKCIALTPNLYEVRLENVCFEEKGLRFFKYIKNLKIISFDKSNISDAGLEYLVDSQEITEMNLSDTFITKEGLKILGQFKSLKSVSLYKTRFLSDSDVFKFKRNNRDVVVHWK